MAKQLLGKEVTAALNERIKGDLEKLKAKGVIPIQGIVRVGERPDDLSYERGAVKRCETLGVSYEKFLLPENVSQDELMETIRTVNKREDIHGVLIFRPLPGHLDEKEVIRALDPEKDVDGITDGSMVGVFTSTAQGFPALYAPGLYGNPGSLWNRLYREKGCSNRTKPGGGKTSRHDASEKERYRYHLSYQNEGYAFRGKRNGYRHRCGRTGRRCG